MGLLVHEDGSRVELKPAGKKFSTWEIKKAIDAEHLTLIHAIDHTTVYWDSEAVVKNKLENMFQVPVKTGHLKIFGKGLILKRSERP